MTILADTPRASRRNLRNLITVVSVTVLVGTEVFGAALAAGWAIAGLFELGRLFEYAFMAMFSLLALWGMIAFVRNALTIEPIRE